MQSSSDTQMPAASPAKDLLAQWLAAEAALAERQASAPAPGALPREQAAAMSGMELLHAMLDGRAPSPTIARTLDFTLVEVGAGHAVFQGTPGPAFANPMGGLHGGWYATLLDSALGCAVHTLMPAGRGYTTAQLSVSLVRAIGPAVRRVRAEGRVVHSGRQLASAEARLVGPDGTLYAHGTAACLVFDLR